jgi:prevent-host-death family protein
MADRLSLSDLRTKVAAVVRKAEKGQPTILTHYKRRVAAIVPMDIFERFEKEAVVSESPSKKRNRASYERL